MGGGRLVSSLLFSGVFVESSSLDLFYRRI